MKQNHIPVFEELTLTGPISARSRLREELQSRATPPWRYASEKESELPTHARGEKALPFERERGDSLEGAALFLWPTAEGFHVSNIIPTVVRELNISAYNAILEDFITHVARPAAVASGFEVKTTATEQSLQEWLPQPAAEALQRFSRSANKSTGSSHPYDQARWFEFLIECTHGLGNYLDTVILIRWLKEVEGWSDDVAHDLAIEYEFGLALLRKYDDSQA